MGIIFNSCYNAVVPITLRQESPIEFSADLVNILINETDYHHSRLVNLKKPETGHYLPDTPAYEQLTAGYFALAVETQGILNRLCVLEDRPLPSTFLSRVPDDMRNRIIEMAKRQGIMIDSSVLKAVPFVPIKTH